MANEPIPPLKTLLAHRAFVRAMARTVLGADVRVDDVEQDTWVAAIEHGGQVRGPLRRWLGVVARNRARRALRDAARVRTREARAPLRADVPEPAEILAQEETRRRLLGVLLALDEGDRQVLLLRYYADLPPTAIARRLGLPLETARSRLRRARARLRRRFLEDEARRGRWDLAALFPLAGIGSHEAALLVGRGLVVKKIVAGAALLLVLLLVVGGGIVLEMRARRDPGGLAPDPALGRTPLHAAAPREPASPRLIGIEAASPPKRPGPSRVRGRVVDPQGRPIPNARIYARRPDVRNLETVFASKATARTDAEGLFALPGPSVPQKGLQVRADGYLGATVSNLSAWSPLRIVLQPANATLAGRVLGADARPLVGARVHAFVEGGEASGTTDGEGRFRLPFQARGEAWLTAWGPHHLTLRRTPIPQPGPDGVRRVDVQLERAVRLRGRVLDAETEAGVPGARIESWEQFGPVPRTGPDGSFDYEAAAAIPWIEAHAPGYVVRKGAVVLDASGHVLPLVIRLVPLKGPRVAGRVVDVHGAAVAGARVLHPGGETDSDIDGIFALEGGPRPGGSSSLLAYHPEQGIAIGEAKVGEDVVLVFPATDAVPGTVLFTDGSKASDVFVHVRPAPEAVGLQRTAPLLARLQGEGGLAVTDDEGRFLLPRLPAGAWRARAWPRPGVGLDSAAQTFESGGERTLLAFTIDAGRTVEGEVRDRRGRPIAGATVQGSRRGPFRLPGRETIGTVTDARGRFRLEGLPEGPVGLYVRAEGYRAWNQRRTLRGRRLVVTLRGLPILRLRITENPPPAGAELMASCEGADGRGEGGGSAFYVGGEVRVELWSRDVRRVRLAWRDWVGGPVDVPADPADTVLDVALRRAGSGDVPARGPGWGVSQRAGAPREDHGFVAGQIAPLLERGAEKWSLLVDGSPIQELGAEETFRVWLPAGGHVLQVGLPEAKGAPREIEVVADTTVETVLAPPEPGGVLRGRLLDADGRFVAGVGVQVRPVSYPEPAGGVGGGSRTTTDADGRFVFHYLTASRYQLFSSGGSDPRGVIVLREVSLDEATVDLRFVRFGFLCGRVTGDWDAPPYQGSIQVGVEREGDDGTVVWASSLSMQADGDGFYFERYLAPGRYRFRAPKGRRWAVVPEDVIVDLDHDAEVSLALTGYR